MSKVSDDYPVHLTWHFDVPVEHVFRAWSDPNLYGLWSWGSLRRNVRAECDFRVGGNFRVETERKDGSKWSFSGTYLEIDPKQAIRHTLAWQAPVGYDPAPEEVAVTFRPDGEGTTIDFVHTGLPNAESAKGHEEGWLNTFETLSALLTKSPNP